MPGKEATGRFSRRAALRIVAGSAGASIGILRLDAETACGTHHSVGKESEDNASPYTPTFFSEEQMITVDFLCERIIPEDAHSPGAHCARVCEYIDSTLSRADRKEKDLWLDGISALNDLSQAMHGQPFRFCPTDQQYGVLEKLAEHEDDPDTLVGQFFVAAKKATVDGYYTSQIGIHQELEYQGNGVLAEFPGCTHSEHKS
ncbi:MAG: gluconate 2-dehydrogenase subunit 3 family protein [Bryobacteraceae bacterium]